jgi:hypothetical protein
MQASDISQAGGGCYGINGRGRQLGKMRRSGFFAASNSGEVLKLIEQ